MIGLIIYLIGYVAGYYMSRRFILKHWPNSEWDWSDVFMNSMTALFSWITAIVFGIASLTIGTKPPRWL